MPRFVVGSPNGTLVSVLLEFQLLVRDDSLSGDAADEPDDNAYESEEQNHGGILFGRGLIITRVIFAIPEKKNLKPGLGAVRV